MITAAHCFFDDGNQTLKNAENYVVAVGKVTRDFNKTDSAITKFYNVCFPSPPHSTIFYVNLCVYQIWWFAQVERIIMEGFYGSSIRYLNDIAILQIKVEMQFSNRVQPVCLRFTEPVARTGLLLQVSRV